MGSSKSVPTPAPIYIKPLSEADLERDKKKAREEQKRALNDTIMTRNRSNNVSSMSRNTGFSGSGVYIPGGS